KTNENGTAKLAGAEFTITKVGDKNFKPVVITTNNEGVASAANLGFGDYVVTETKAPVGYSLTAKPQNVTINAGNVTTVQGLTFKDTAKTGSISVTKTNENGTAKLAGAEFTITKVGDKNFKPVVITTNNEGVASAANLGFGDYVVTETKAPVGYNIAAKPQNVTINASNVTTVQALTFKDTQIEGNVVITKVGEDKTPLAGATIAIYNSANKEVFTGTTNDKGQISTILPFGKYTYKELKAPVGYTLSTKVGTLEITTNGTTVTGEIQDVRITGKVIITKIGMDNEPLEGAIIGIYNSSNQEVYHGVTDVKGQINTTLPYGKYTYKELKAPIGYTLSKKVGNFEIDKNGETATGSIQDIKITGIVNILKTNEEGKALAGAVIQIENADGKVVFKGTTPQNGLLSVKLPFGTYVYKEIAAPKGYNINSLEGKFTIMTNNEIINKKIVDSKISITTTDDTKNHFEKEIKELPDTGIQNDSTDNLVGLLATLLVGLGLLSFGFRKRN
ncbi:MAG: MSCRAMM family protein, partial [Sarcina sp.]